VNINSYLVIYNIDSIKVTITNARPYIRLDTPFLSGNFLELIAIAPKYDSLGNVDSRYVIFVGEDSTVGLNRLGVLVFDSALVGLPAATVLTPPLSSTIPFTGFKSPMTMEVDNLDGKMIRTSPDFPNLIILAGFKSDFFSIFEIVNNMLLFRHNTRYAWTYRNN
jgi:hypothetical protein